MCKAGSGIPSQLSTYYLHLSAKGCSGYFLSVAVSKESYGWFIEERGRRRFDYKDRVFLRELSSARPVQKCRIKRLMGSEPCYAFGDVGALVLETLNVSRPSQRCINLGCLSILPLTVFNIDKAYPNTGPLQHHSDAWKGGKLHPHSCIPDARRACDQIENANTWDFFSNFYKSGLSIFTQVKT